MRDIRFRAWDKEWLAMSAPMEIFKNGQGFFFFKGFGTRCAEHEQLIVMQSTGLKDCKRTEEYPEGQEIYQGDISWRYYNKKYPHLVGAIEWDSTEAQFVWHAHFPEGGGALCRLGHYLNGHSDSHKEGESKQDNIIGDIHTTPEKMEASDGA